MFKKFIMRKMLASKLKNVPESQRDTILSAVEKNPELFQKIAKEVDEKVKAGKDQTMATFDVRKKYEKELRELMQ